MNRSASKFRRQVTCRSWIQTTLFHAAKLVVNFASSTTVGKITRHVISVTFLFWIIPIAGLLLMLMAAYKWTMQRVIQYVYPEEQLQVADTLSIRMAFDSSDKLQSLVTLMMILSGLPDIEQIRNKVDQLLDPAGPLGHRAALFKSVLMTKFGIHCWKPCHDRFRVENHVILHSGRWRGTTVTARNLQTFASEVLSFKTLPRASPPWQIIVVPVRQLDCRSVKYAMIIRVHHLLMNGINILRDILVSPKNCFSNLSTAAEEEVKTVPQTTPVETSPSAINQVPGEYLELVLSILNQLYRLFSLAIIFPPLFWNHILGHSPVRNHLVDKVDQKDKAANLAWSEDIPLTLLDRIEEKTGFSKKEILIACFTGAVRHYFQKMSGVVPKNVFCALPESEKDDSCVYQERPSNVYSLTLPVGKIDPLSRLSAINFRNFEVRKQFSDVAAVTGTLLNNIQRFIPSWLTRITLNTVTKSYTFLLNNISIPSNCVTSWGSVVESISYWRPPLANIGVSLSLVTYGDKVSLGILACPSTLHRPDELSVFFVKEVHDLALSLDVKMERITPPPSPCGRDIL